MEQEIITSVRFMGSAIMFALALILFFIYKGRIQSRTYNLSRYYIAGAVILLGIHNVIQFFGHYRAEHTDLAWTINIAFFVLITILLNLSGINLLRAGQRMRRIILFECMCALVVYAVMWLTVTAAAAALYSAMLVVITRTLHHDMKRAYAYFTDEELHEHHVVLTHLVKSLRLLMIISFIAPWLGMSSSLVLHSVWGCLVYAAMLWYIISFLFYGYSMSAVIGVDDEIYEGESQEADAANQEALQQNNYEILSSVIERWVQQRRYTDPSMSIGTALQEMDITAATLNFYLQVSLGIDGYRQWIPYLRIEEAKRLMLANPNYSLDAIAEECGYSNRPAFSRAFKTLEGIPPGEWQKKNQTVV